jgi:hypothetical protein
MPPAHQEFWGQKSIFYIHGIYTPYLICGGLKFLVGNSVLAFVIFCALQVLLISVTTFYILKDASKSFLYGALGAFSIGFSSFALGQVGYPHFELMGVGLLSLGVFLYLKTSSRWGLLLILLGCLTREDMGAHLILITAIHWFFKGGKLKEFRGSKSFLIASIAMIGLLINYSVSKIIFNSSSRLFKMAYVGEPPFEILFNPIGLLQRVSVWITANPGIVAMLIIFSLGYALTKENIFIALVVAPLPWILINLIAPDPAKQTLGIYHGYPFVLYICGLVAFFLLDPAKGKSGWNKQIGKIFIVALLSNSIFASVAAQPSGSSYLFYYNLKQLPISSKVIQDTNKSLQNLSKALEAEGKILIDDAVASIITSQDRYILSESNLESTLSVKAFVYFPNYVLGQALRDRLKTKEQLNFRYCISGTNIEVISKTLEDANNLKIPLIECKSPN